MGKWAAILVCHDDSTKAWEGSRLKLAGLDAVPTYKRLVPWFLRPAEDTEWYFLQLHRLNQGLDTGHWKVYERKEEPNGVRLVLSIDTASIAVLEGLETRLWGVTSYLLPSRR